MTDEAKFLNRPVASWPVEYEEEVVTRGTTPVGRPCLRDVERSEGRPRLRIDWLIPGISWCCHAISTAASRSSASVPCASGCGRAAPHRRCFITTRVQREPECQFCANCSHLRHTLPRLWRDRSKRPRGPRIPRSSIQLAHRSFRHAPVLKETKGAARYVAMNSISTLRLESQQFAHYLFQVAKQEDVRSCQLTSMCPTKVLSPLMFWYFPVPPVYLNVPGMVATSPSPWKLK